MIVGASLRRRPRQWETSAISDVGRPDSAGRYKDSAACLGSG